MAFFFEYLRVLSKHFMYMPSLSSTKTYEEVIIPIIQMEKLRLCKMPLLSFKYLC